MNKFLRVITLIVFIAVLSACKPQEVIEDDVDTEAPIIVLSGGTASVTIGDSFVAPTCSVTDNIDTDLTCTISGEVDEEVAGQYTLTYTAMDSEGNNAMEKTFMVLVAERVFETYLDALRYLGEYDSTVDQNHILQFINMINDNEFIEYYLTVSGQETYSDDVLTAAELEEFEELLYSYTEFLFDDSAFAIQDFFFEEGDFVYLDATKEVLMRYIGNDSDVTIPNGVKTVGFGAFSDMDITSVTIPSSVLVLSLSSFYENHLMSVTIPQSVESVGFNAFGDNPLEEVVIEGMSTRFDYKWLDIGFPKYLATFITSTDDGLEFNKSNGEIIGYTGTHTTLVIPSEIEGVSVTAIDGYVFSYSRFTGITIPESVTRIAYEAFYGNSLTSLTILGDDSRFDTMWLDIGFPKELASFIITTDDGFEFNKVTGEIIGYSGASTTLVIPSMIEGVDVTEIRSNAFDYSGLTEVTIPISITSIDYDAFYGNPFTSITILGDDTRFDDMWLDIGFPVELAAFIVTTDDGLQFNKNTGQLIGYFGTSTTLIIPSEIEGVEVSSIRAWLFEYRDLSDVTIPETITEIYYGAFEGNSLTSLTILGDNSRFDEDWLDIGFPIELADFIVTTDDGLQFNKSTGVIIGYVGSLTMLVIPSEIEGVAVTEIGSNVFERNRSITSVTIPDSVIIIGSRAFASSKGVLTTLELGNGVQEIGYEAFKGHGIVNIVIPESVESIESYAFYPTNELDDPIASVVIEGDQSRFDDEWQYIGFPLELAPFVVTTDEGLRFNGFSGEIIGYVGTETMLVLPSEINGTAVTGIGYRALEYKNLTDITIPESITMIQYGSFYGNPLASITIIGDNTRFDDMWLDIGFPVELASFIVTTDNGLQFNKNNGAIFGYIGTDSILILPSEIEGVTVDSITYAAFAYKGITEVTIPESITWIEYEAFYGNSLTIITILGDQSRFNDDWEYIGFPIELASFIVTTEEGLEFNGMSGMIIGYTGTETVLVLPSEIDGIAVTGISYGTFEYSDVTDVTIPESITTIYYGAFYGSPLTSITILGDASRFDSDWEYIGFPIELAPFIVTTEEGFRFNSYSGVIIDYIGTETVLVLPSEIDGVTVTSIAYAAFEYEDLTDITIPESIVWIDYGAFYGNLLTSITILGDTTRFNDMWLDIGFPAELATFIVTTDDNIQFNKNTGVIIGYTGTETILVLPSEIDGVIVSSIAYGVFQYHDITELTIPESIIWIEYGAFTGNPLTTITILGDSSRFDNVWFEIGFPLDLTEVDSVNVLIGDTISDSIGVAGDSDYYMFEVFEITYIVIYSESENDTVAHLFDENSELIEYDDDSGEVNNFLIELELNPGVYYIRVKAYNSSSVFDYTLHIEGSPS